MRMDYLLILHFLASSMYARCLFVPDDMPIWINESDLGWLFLLNRRPFTIKITSISSFTFMCVIYIKFPVRNIQISLTSIDYGLIAVDNLNDTFWWRVKRFQGRKPLCLVFIIIQSDCVSTYLRASTIDAFSYNQTNFHSGQRKTNNHNHIFQLLLFTNFHK